MTRYLALGLIAALAPPAAAQSLNMQLVGQVNPRPSQGYHDIWGYVASNGREYALVGTRNDGGLTVIDVTAEPPVEVDFLPGPGGIGSDVEVYQDYVYVSNDQRPTRIYSLADPTNVAFIGEIGGAGGPDAHTITVAGDYLYTQGGPSPGGVRIYSLADPENPTFLGQYQPHYVHDIMIRGDTMYTAGIFDDGIDIVDISNRASPAMINRFNYPGSGAHNICSTLDGSYIYVGDEIGTGQWTRIFDVRDPLNVELVGQIILEPGTTVHNCHVLGDLLYMGYYDGNGARVYDISNPTAPVEVAYFETGSGMMWSVYPHLPSGKIIGSRFLSGGVYVWRLTVVPTEQGPSLDGDFALSVSPNPSSGALRFTFELPEATDVRLAVYDVLGREMATVVDGALGAGAHAVAADALPAGVYVARLMAGGRSASVRVTVVR